MPLQIKDFVSYAFECQICGSQGEVGVSQASCLDGAIATMQADGWGMTKYKEESEDLKRLACPECFIDTPKRSIHGNSFDDPDI